MPKLPGHLTGGNGKMKGRSDMEERVVRYVDAGGVEPYADIEVSVFEVAGEQHLHFFCNIDRAEDCPNNQATEAEFAIPVAEIMRLIWGGKEPTGDEI